MFACWSAFRLSSKTQKIWIDRAKAPWEPRIAGALRGCCGPTGTFKSFLSLPVSAYDATDLSFENSSLRFV